METGKHLKAALFWAELYREDFDNGIVLSGHERSVIALADEVLSLREEVRSLHSSGHCECGVCTNE